MATPTRPPLHAGPDRTAPEPAGTHDAISPFCPAYHRAIELIGRRWTGAVLRVLLSGATRYSEIVALVPGLSDRLLSERLRELEAEGIVTRTVFPEIPVRIEYGLTDKGRALGAVVESVSHWAEQWLGPSIAPCAEPEQAPRASGCR